MDVAYYMAQVYESPPCWQLVADVHARELDQPVDEYKTVSTSIRDVAAAFRLALHKSPNGFQRITEPQDYAIVLMGKTPKLGLHHCGIYYDGKVLHALDSGTVFQELPSLRAEYPLMEFWSKAP
jgi:hypothetical protein